MTLDNLNPPLDSYDPDDYYGGGDVPEGICPDCDLPYAECVCDEEEE